MANNIPSYQQTVETRPLPTPYSAPDVSPGDLGAAQGAGLQQLGASTDQIAREATQQEAAAHAAYAGTQEETVRTIANLSAVPTTPVYEIAGQFNRIANQAKAEAVRKLGSGATGDMVAAAVLPELQRASVTAMDAVINSKSPDF